MIYLLLAFFGALAWFISTAAAGGAAILLIPVVGFLLGSRMVAPVISVAAFIANPSRAFLFRKHIHWSVITYLVPGSIVGALVGAWTLMQINVQLIQILLGVFLVSYVLQDRLGRSRLKCKMILPLFLPLGFIVSFLSGLIGATGPVHNPFLLSYGLVKEGLVATKAINSLIMQLTKLVSYSVFGALTMNNAVFGIVLGLGAIIGVYLARHHLAHIDVDRFRHYTLSIMMFCGIVMLVKAV